MATLPLTNGQLQTLLSNDPYFIGVYSRDCLPMSLINCRRQQPPLTLIVNTDTSNLGGRHWVAVFIDELYHGEYFDSLSQPIPQHISLWLSRFSNQWNYVLRPFIDPPIQSINSLTCGAFTYYFVRQRPFVDSSEQVLLPFHHHSTYPSLISNDQFVLWYMNKKYV